jgi:hypothetical protein
MRSPRSNRFAWISLEISDGGDWTSPHARSSASRLIPSSSIVVVDIHIAISTALIPSILIPDRDDLTYMTRYHLKPSTVNDYLITLSRSIDIIDVLNIRAWDFSLVFVTWKRKKLPLDPGRVNLQELALLWRNEYHVPPVHDRSSPRKKHGLLSCWRAIAGGGAPLGDWKRARSELMLAISGLHARTRYGEHGSYLARFCILDWVITHQASAVVLERWAATEMYDITIDSSRGLTLPFRGNIKEVEWYIVSVYRLLVMFPPPSSHKI